MQGDIALTPNSIVACDDTPKRQLAFFNSSDRTLNIVLEKDSVYWVDKVLEPHSVAYAYIDTGTYDIITYTDSGYYVRSIDKYELKEETEAEKYGYICIDLEGKSIYALVMSSYLYEANNSLAQIYQDNLNINESNFIRSYYKSDKPINLTFGPIFPYEPLPKEIGAMDAGWALVPITETLETKEEIYSYIDNYFYSIGIE